MSIATELLDQYQTERLKAKMFDFPGLIKEQKAKVREARETYQEAEQNRAIIEADIMTDISCEKDLDTGKATYSNEKTRQAELLKRKAIDADYQEVAKAAKDAEFILNEAQDELDRLFDEFKSCRYVVNLVSQELAVIAGNGESEEVRYELTGKGQMAVGGTEPY